MSEDSFAHERALITLLARLNLDFEGRITQFIAARQAGGGANRNRRRRAAGREALRDLDQALGIAILHTEERLANILIPLREAVAARLVVIEAPGFTWYRTDPLLPDFNIEDVAFAFEVGVGESTEALENRISQPPNASEPATGAVPFNATESTDAIAAPSEPIAIAAPSEPIDVDTPSTPLRRSRSPPPVSGSAIDLDRDYRDEFPSIEESFVPKASGVSIDSGFVGDWTSEQWREYNRQQELATSSTGGAAASSSSADGPTFDAPVVRAIATLHKCIERSADLRSAIVSMDLSRVTHVVSLDFHKVIDRSWRSSVETFRTLGSRPEVCLIVLSKCSDRRLIEDSFAYIRRLVEATDYSVRDLPILYIRAREGPNGKCSRLYDALRGTSLADLPVAHFDDKWPIVREFNGFGRYGWKGVWMDPQGRMELDAAVNNTLAEFGI
ncbi:hypothetical protein AK812_SmicGene28530 [Symbiodinium microadriaticum]|uniref:Uncharacterized protein n=1 Tax=Symbiodinium microadriaticum TaxID=2951 RepID=A0A1Q9D489_SYMMI|nr:hypothetical protein AK812_SmicGene28530 [Symbiodinium microadriaticum]